MQTTTHTLGSFSGGGGDCRSNEAFALQALERRLVEAGASPVAIARLLQPAPFAAILVVSACDGSARLHEAADDGGGGRIRGAPLLICEPVQGVASEYDGDVVRWRAQLRMPLSGRSSEAAAGPPLLAVADLVRVECRRGLAGALETVFALAPAPAPASAPAGDRALLATEWGKGCHALEAHLAANGHDRGESTIPPAPRGCSSHMEPMIERKVARDSFSDGGGGGGGGVVGSGSGRVSDAGADEDDGDGSSSWRAATPRTGGAHRHTRTRVLRSAALVVARVLSLSRLVRRRRLAGKHGSETRGGVGVGVGVGVGGIDDGSTEAATKQLRDAKVTPWHAESTAAATMAPDQPFMRGSAAYDARSRESVQMSMPSLKPSAARTHETVPGATTGKNQHQPGTLGLMYPQQATAAAREAPALSELAVVRVVATERALSAALFVPTAAAEHDMGGAPAAKGAAPPLSTRTSLSCEACEGALSPVSRLRAHLTLEPTVQWAAEAAPCRAATADDLFRSMPAPCGAAGDAAHPASSPAPNPVTAGPAAPVDLQRLQQQPSGLPPGYVAYALTLNAGAAGGPPVAPLQAVAASIAWLLAMPPMPSCCAG